jgi:hypothetical protein
VVGDVIDCLLLICNEVGCFWLSVSVFIVICGHWFRWYLSKWWKSFTSFQFEQARTSVEVCSFIFLCFCILIYLVWS